jgi:hypothetical protein
MAFKILTQNGESIITQNNLYYLVYGRPLPPIEVNSQYEYTIGMLGNFSGGSITEGGPSNGFAPHPVFTDAYGVEYIQLNSITLGGFNGLNN